MSNNIDYAWEKLYATVLSMAESPDPLEKRLPRVWFDQLSRLRPEHFDGPLVDLKSDFESIRDTLSRDDAEALLTEMDADQLYTFGRSITQLYDRVSSIHRQHS